MRHHRNALAASALALPMVLGGWPADAADLVETLRQSGRFSLLVGAIEQAGLAETLKGEGPFTVFAPTDQAFNQIPLGVFNALLKDENRGDLRALLGHHVVEGRELSARQVLGQEMRVDTLQGEGLTLDGTGAVVLLVPTGLSVARIGDQVFVEREVAAVTRPAITVSATGQGTGQAGGGQQQAQGQQAQGQGQQQQQQQQQPTAGTSGQGASAEASGLEALEERYAMLRDVPMREVRQALEAARQGLQQRNAWLVDLNLERAELALRQADLDRRREVSRLLDEADRALQEDDWQAARRALQQVRQTMPREDYPAQVWSSLQETRAALGQGDLERGAQSLWRAERAAAQAEGEMTWRAGGGGQQERPEQFLESMAAAFREALRDVRRGVEQRDEQAAQMAMERAEQTLRYVGQGVQEQVRGALAEAEQALQRGDWRRADEALQRVRDSAAWVAQQERLGRALGEARTAMGAGDWQGAGRSLAQAEQGAMAAIQQQPEDGETERAQQRQRTLLGEQQGLFRAAMVVEPDIEADNGVIHAINEVLVPQELEQRLAEVLRPDDGDGQGGPRQEAGQQTGQRGQQQQQQEEDETQQGGTPQQREQQQQQQ